MNNKVKDSIRNFYIEKLQEWIANYDPDVDILRTKSNELTIPIVDEDSGDEGYLTFVLKIPTGERGGDPYDGYEEADNYKAECEAKRAKEEEAARKKAAKIARDTQLRAEKAAARAKK